MKLYIIRHAETEYNRNGIIQGSEVDSDINDVGESQANSFYEYYKNINFDKIYVSNLKRTFQTIRRFTEKGSSYEKLKEFNEISWGVNQGKSDDLEDYARLIDTWLAGNLDNKFDDLGLSFKILLRSIFIFLIAINPFFSKLLIVVSENLAVFLKSFRIM